MDKSDSQIIEDAVEIIKENGICRGSFHNADMTSESKKSCALGSVALAIGDRAEIVASTSDDSLRLPYQRVRKELNKDLLSLKFDCKQLRNSFCGENYCTNIAHYNDRVSVEEVVDLMMTTAKRLRNQGR